MDRERVKLLLVRRHLSLCFQWELRQLRIFARRFPLVRGPFSIKVEDIGCNVMLQQKTHEIYLCTHLSYHLLQRQRTCGTINVSFRRGNCCPSTTWTTNYCVRDTARRNASHTRWNQGRCRGGLLLLMMMIVLRHRFHNRRGSGSRRHRCDRDKVRPLRC